MDKIQFNIKYRPEIEAGKYKVVTGDGRPVRIICWDFKGDYKIVAAILAICGDEAIKTYTNEGLYVTGKRYECDLFLITPKPELSEFEEVLLEIVHRKPEEATEIELRGMRIYRDKLLALARKEIEKDLPKLKKCSWNFEHGDIGITREGEDILSYKGYEILLSELFDKLPKED